MAASRKGFAILLTHLKPCTYKRTLAFREPRLFSSLGAGFLSHSSNCYTSRAGLCRTLVAFQPLGSTAESKASSSFGNVARPKEIYRGEFVRRASTHGPSESARVEQEGGQKEETKPGMEEATAAEDEKEEVFDERTQTLRAALAHVPTLGWTEAAIVAGARDAGLSPSIAGSFPRKEAALVEFFMDECTQALIEELESRGEELGKLVMHDRIARIVWMRLEMQIPYLPKWAQALSVQANPVNFPSAVRQRASLTEEIWHSAGDRSADVDWYAKRAVLTAVYSTTELYMLTDTSPGFKETQAFLERRINDALDCRKTIQEAGHLARAVQAGFQNTVNSFLSRRNRPSGFGM